MDAQDSRLTVGATALTCRVRERLPQTEGGPDMSQKGSSGAIDRYR